MLAAAMLVLAACGGGGGGGSSAPGPVTSPPTAPPAPPASPFTVANPFAVPGATSVQQVRVDDLRVFGDSYSQEGFGGTTVWSTALRKQGTVARTESYAFGGARANSNGSNSLETQIDNWQGSGSAIGSSDLTVVYIGHNDLGGDVAASQAGYREGVDRLVAGGATGDNRRLFVTMLHDWSRNPQTNGVSRQQVVDWNTFVAGIANGNDRIIAVDLFTAFNRVFERPGDYGLANVTTVDVARSTTDALYFDPLHFGNKGQELIARVYRHYLTRGWDWANSLAAGGAAAQRLRSDLDNGLLALAGDPGADTSRLGLSTVALGNGGNVRPPSAAAETTPSAFDGPSRTGFAETYRVGSAAGGIALDYRPAPHQRFGLAVSRYDSFGGTNRGAASLGEEQSSNGLALYWQRTHGGIQATSQFAFLQHYFSERAQDDMIGQSGVTRHTGRTWAFDQRLARPTRTGRATLTPWASLGYQSHELDPYSAKSLYTSDISYGGASATDVTGALGLELRHDPIALGGGLHLWLGGGASYVSSLYRDDVEVTMREAAMPDLDQRETIERERIARFDLTLDAALGLARDLHLRAGYGLTADRADHEQRIRLSLDYRF